MVNKEKKIIVLMPPKTASNSVKNSFRESGYPFDRFKKSYDKPKIHLYLSELVDVFDIKDLSEYKVLQVVRNPFERFVSSYFHQMKSVNKAKADIPFKGYTIFKFTKFLENCLESENFEKSFYGENKFLTNAQKKGTWGGSRLYKNQTEWNDVDGIETKYFKLQDLSNDITPLNKYLGFDINPLPKINTNPISVDYNDYLTEQIIAFVKKRFASDIKKLNYKNGIECKPVAKGGQG